MYIMKKFIKNRLNLLIESYLQQNNDINKLIDENTEDIPKDVIDSFKLQSGLNKDIWDDKDTLNPKVKFKLLEIAKDFFKDLELPKDIKIKDIIFTGSLANFNWSKFSDIDLHLIIDFNQFKEDKDFITKHFKTEKTLWNDNHDIKIYSYPIEIYVQDVDDKLEATAIYSVLHNKWVLKPSKQDFKVDISTLKKKGKKFFNQFDDIKKDFNNKNYKQVVKKIDTLWDRIKYMRQSGLEEGGEFSIENILFKVLRRTPFMDDLDEMRKDAYDKSMTLNEGVINENNIWYDGGILLIKGAKDNEGNQRLFATHIKKIIELPRNRKDDSKGVAARMALLSDVFYLIKEIPNPNIEGNTILKGFKMDYKTNISLSKVLKMKGQSASVVINNNKVPLHWETLRYNSIGVMLNKLSNDIKQIPDINLQ